MILLDGISRRWHGNGIVRKLSALRKKYVGDEPATRPPPPLDFRTRAGVVALLLLTPAAALWSKHFDNIHDADSLLVSLISLQKLTLFYWGADRFGNLLPFLTAWIHDINLNFQAQVYLRALGAASVPLLVFSFIGLRRYFFASYAIALALSFLLFNDTGNAVWVWITPYGHSIPPFLGALLLHYRNQYRFNARDLLYALGTLLFVCLALYVNGGLVIFAVPLWAAYAVLFPRARNWWFVAILMAGYFFYRLLSAHYGREYHDAYDYSRITFRVSNFAHFWETFVSVVSLPVFAACLAVIAGGLGVVQWTYRRRCAPGSPLLEPLVLRSLLILPVAVVYILMFANMDWVTERNHSAFRYFWFALVLAAPLCSAALTQGIFALVGPARDVSGSQEKPSRFALSSAVVAVFAVALSATTVFHSLAPFGIPSSFVRQPQRADTMFLAALARRYGANYVAGDYYVVWPAVFESIRRAQDSNDPAALQIRGLGLRGEHLRGEIADSLRSSERVVILGAKMSPADCYGHALYNNAIDWPPNASMVAAGVLPSGGNYCVLAFDRKTPPPDAVRLPRISTVLMVMLSLDPQIAHRNQGRIDVAAGRAGKVWGGPFVNLPAGKYTVAFQVQVQADASTPLLELTVTDGFGSRKYNSVQYRAGDLKTNNGSTWATIDFTVPESSPTRVMEFVMNTSGKAPFSVSAMDLRRDP